MNGTERTEALIAVALDRLILLLMLLILAAILTAAMVMQYAFGEIPCPLCLLQRFAMFGCCFGLVQQLHSGSTERGTGISLIFSILLLVISARQTLLDLVPRPGHELCRQRDIRHPHAGLVRFHCRRAAAWLGS